MGRRILHLASNRLFWKLGDPYVHPRSVDVSVEPAPATVTVAEGITHNAVAANISVQEALGAEWTEHFERAEARWLRPYLQRIGDGEVVSESELIAHFVHLHGRQPNIFDSRCA